MIELMSEEEKQSWVDALCNSSTAEMDFPGDADEFMTARGFRRIEDGLFVATSHFCT